MWAVGPGSQALAGDRRVSHNERLQRKGGRLRGKGRQKPKAVTGPTRKPVSAPLCAPSSTPTKLAGRMRILVALKRVVDYNARIRVKPDKVECGK